MSIGTGNVGNLNYNSAYSQTFGNMPDGTVISNGWENIDMRPEIKSLVDKGIKAQLKSLSSSTGGAGTAGNAMVPVYVDPVIVDRSRKATPFAELIKRVTNLGLTADFNVITAKGSAYTANEDAPLPEADDTYDRVSKSIKFLYAVGRITGQAQAAYPSYIVQGLQAQGAVPGQGNYSDQSAPNAMELEILMKARQLKELEENLIFNGDSSTTSTEFDGLIQLQSTTNQKDVSNAALTWDDIEDAIQLALDDGGLPKVAACGTAVLADLRKLMIDAFRFGPDQLTQGASLPFGVSANLVLHTAAGPIPVIASRFLSNTSGSKQLWFLDTDVIEMRVLQDMTFEKLAKTNDSEKFMLKMYECLINRAPQFSSFIDNIA